MGAEEKAGLEGVPFAAVGGGEVVEAGGTGGEVAFDEGGIGHVDAVTEAAEGVEAGAVEDGVVEGPLRRRCAANSFRTSSMSRISLEPEFTSVMSSMFPFRANRAFVSVPSVRD